MKVLVLSFRDRFGGDVKKVVDKRKKLDTLKTKGARFQNKTVPKGTCFYFKI